MVVDEVAKELAAKTDLSASQSTQVVETVVTTVSEAIRKGEASPRIEGDAIAVNLDNQIILQSLIERLNLSAGTAQEVFDQLVRIVAIV